MVRIPVRKYRRRNVGSLVACLLAVTFTLAGCVTNGGAFSDLTSGNWFGSSEPGAEESVVMGRDPAVLANGGVTEVTIHNAVELSRQKRFVEARFLLADIRENQAPESEGYRAVSCAMALLALREGDIKTFKRIARQLDNALGRPVRVPPAYVEVVSLYRAINNRALPVNAPGKFSQLKERFFTNRSAGT